MRRDRIQITRGVIVCIQGATRRDRITW